MTDKITINGVEYVRANSKPAWMNAPPLWPSEEELREMAEDVGDTLEPALEMARLLREWQTGGDA